MLIKTNFEHPTGCCQILTVTLENAVKSVEHSKEGVYYIMGEKNGRNYWLKTDHEQVIWYIPEFKDWGIANTKTWILGSTERGIDRY